MPYGETKPLGLACLGVAPGTAKLVSYFARNPTARPTVRELQRTLGIASASAQRDLARLLEAGAVRVVEEGRMLRYAARESPLWAATRLLIDESSVDGWTARTMNEESAERYGVDVSALRSQLRLSVEERLMQLDANAAFLSAARRGRRTQR